MKLGKFNLAQNLSQKLGCAIACVGIFSGTSSAFALESLTSSLEPTVYAGDPNGSPVDSPANRVTTDPKYAGVGSISVSCSGAAISLTHVLSAAHCFNPSSPNVSFILNSTSYAGVVSVFPGAVFPFDDVAVITLGQSLPADTPIYDLYRNPVPLSDEIEFVGFGNSGNGVTGNSSGFDFNVKRLGYNVADFFYIQNGQNISISTDESDRTALIGFDFDGSTLATSFSGTPGNSGTIGNDRESTYGGGDSGSPNFINVNGTLKIVGVSTGVLSRTGFSSPFFGSGGIFTDVSGFTGFIDGVVTPVPFEFSPVIGVSLLGIWGVIAKLITRLGKQ